MTKRTYFDTVAFRTIGKAFEKTNLAEELRARIVVSPITAFEVLSQLSIVNADEVLCQIHGLHRNRSVGYARSLAEEDAAGSDAGIYRVTKR